MAGKRSFKKVTFNRSTEGDSVFKVVSIPEGGAMGYFSAWHRRSAGIANATITAYGTFTSNPDDPGDAYELTSGNIYDNLNSAMWGWYAEFPYIAFVVNFSDSESSEDTNQPATVDLYLVSY